MRESVADVLEAYRRPPPPAPASQSAGERPCCACNKKGTSRLSTCKISCTCRDKNVLCTNCVNCKRGTCTNFVYPASPVVCNDEDGSFPSADPASPAPSSFVDDKMREAFGEPLINSSGGSTFPEWEDYHQRACQLRLRCVALPDGNLGRAITDAVAGEVDAIAKLEAPADRLFVFIRTLIQRDPDVRKGKDVKRMLWRRLEMWREGLVEELLCEAERLDEHFATTQPPLDDESVFRIFNRLMLQGKIKAAVRFVTERGGGGVLHPSAQAEKRPPGVTVLDVLREKHPPQQTPCEEAFLPCDSLPPLIDVDITDSTVERAAQSLSGSAGPTGGDAEFWQGILLRFGAKSGRLRTAVANLVSAMANTILPWDNIKALRSCRLIALDKQPGVRPIGIGEVLSRLTGKCMASATRSDLESTCGTDQLCIGVKAGIEGAVHGMGDLFSEDGTEGLLLVDAANAFNSISRPAAIWNTRVLWPRCSRYVFNTYRGFAALYLQGSTDCLWSREGVTQGDSLSMLVYACGSLPLIHALRDACAEEGYEMTSGWEVGGEDTNENGPPEAHGRPTEASVEPSEGEGDDTCVCSGIDGVDVGEDPPAASSATSTGTQLRQCWYADDSSGLGKLLGLLVWFRALRRIGPSFGYHPEPAKSFLIVKPGLEQTARELFASEGVQIVTGKRFLGGYVGDEEGKTAFLREKVEGWVRSVRVLSSAARNFPDAAHAAMTRSLQMEWDYVLRVVLTDERALSPLRDAIVKEFLPALFGGPVTRAEADLMLLPARFGGTGIYDPLDRAASAYPASRAGTKLVSRSIQGKAPFHPGDHRAILRRALKLSREQQDAAHKSKMESARPRIDSQRHRVINRNTEYKTSAWLTTLPLRASNTDLDASEFRDTLNRRYGRHPPNLPPRCEPCNVPLTVTHALDCKKGGRVTGRHNELRDTFFGMMGMTWGYTGVRREVVLKEGEEGARGVVADIVARGVWERQAAASFDICIIDADAPSYASRNRSTKSILKEHENRKKAKYREAVRDSHMSFCPLVVTCDGVWGHDANIFIAHMARALMQKEGWRGRSFSHVSGWIRSRLSTALARATSFCLRGGGRSYGGVGCEDGAGMDLSSP